MFSSTNIKMLWWNSHLTVFKRKKRVFNDFSSLRNVNPCQVIVLLCSKVVFHRSWKFLEIFQMNIYDGVSFAVNMFLRIIRKFLFWEGAHSAHFNALHRGIFNSFMTESPCIETSSLTGCYSIGTSAMKDLRPYQRSMFDRVQNKPPL